MGFGSTPDGVDAEARLCPVGADGRATVLQSFAANGTGGAAAAASVTSRADSLAADQAHARKVADLLAEKIAGHAARQGWMAAAGKQGRFLRRWA